MNLEELKASGLYAELQKGLIEDLISDRPRWLNPEIDKAMEQIRKQLATTATGFPARENLEAEAKILIPLDTPLRNRITRVPGSGKAASWKVITSFGTLVTGFYPEGGTPTKPTTVYADRSKTYCCLGIDGEVTGLAIAAGASFGDLLAAEKRFKLLQLMREEEKQILQGDSSADANAFDGLIKQIDADNGAQETDINGAITWAAIDAMCLKIFNAGGNANLIVLHPHQANVLTQALQGQGSILRVEVLPDNRVSAGIYVGAYINPLTGAPMDIIISRDLKITANQSDLLIISSKMPAGETSVEMDVLQEYGTYPIAVDTDSVCFRVNCYEVLKVRGLVFCGKLTRVNTTA